MTMTFLYNSVYTVTMWPMLYYQVYPPCYSRPDDHCHPFYNTIHQVFRVLLLRELFTILLLFKLSVHKTIPGRTKLYNMHHIFTFNILIISLWSVIPLTVFVYRSNLERMYGLFLSSLPRQFSMHCFVVHYLSFGVWSWYCLSFFD